MAEVPKNDINDIEDNKLKEGEKTDSRLRDDMAKGGKNIENSMGTLAQQEINTIKSSFSPDELNNPQYTEQFASEQKNLSLKTQEILAWPEKPEEKIKSLKRAFEEFQSKVAGIKGTKEGMDAQRGTQNAENIQKEGKNAEEKGQKFKETLLKGIQSAREAEIQKEVQTARFLIESEGKKSQVAANETLGKEMENLDWPGTMKA